MMSLTFGLFTQVSGSGPLGPLVLTKLCPFFDLEFSTCSYSRALAPACGALVPPFLERETIVTSCLLASLPKWGLLSRKRDVLGAQIHLRNWAPLRERWLK